MASKAVEREGADAGSPPRAEKAKPVPLPRVDFSNPPGAPALYPPDSVAWRVFKNPVSLFIGGIAAVLLELGEPRVREGVWGHSIFPQDPILRMRRTGLMTHASVYAPRETAERMIAGVVRMHEKVRGVTPEGLPYHANDEELLNWVQATVDYGFMEAYAQFVRPLSDEERDRFYRESIPVAHLFRAFGAPASLAEQQAQFEAMRPHIVAHPIVDEFLGIVTTVPAVPRPLRPLQNMLVRAGIDMLPEWAKDQLGLRGRWRLKGWERRTIKTLGALFERIPLRGTPPVLASQRLGLSTRYLYGR